MASRSGPRSNPIADKVVSYGELAYNPSVPAENSSAHIGRFEDFLTSTKTLALMPVLTALLQPGRAQPWLRPQIAHALALLPMRPRGVRNTIEFILSVHPSTAPRAGASQSQSTESRGPSITLEALNSASRLISSPPSDLSPEVWFYCIAPQLLGLLDGEGGLEMIKVASFIIGYGILGRKALGAPGSVGWKAFAEPLLSNIDPNLASQVPKQVAEKHGTGAAVPVAKGSNVLVTAPKVAEALRRLASLLSSHPNPGLSKRLLDPLVLPLWALASWPLNKVEEADDEWRAPATFLLQILLKLSSDGAQLITLAQNLLYQGNKGSLGQRWMFSLAPGGGVQIETYSSDSTFLSSGLDLEALGVKVNAFVELVRPLADIDDVPVLFLSLCKRWLLKAREPTPSPTIVLPGQRIMSDEISDEAIVEGKLMQKLMTVLPERLVSDSSQIVELAREVLDKALHSGENLDDDDTVAVALSLLNLTFTGPSFNKEYASRLVKEPIKVTLEHISRKIGTEASVTARNLLLLLDFTSAYDELSSSASKVDKDAEDRRTYSLALSYLRALDSPPPVRAQGLDLISTLIVSGSPMLDIPAILILLSSLLQDDEEYIYLRAIKAFISLSIKHPKTVISDLMEHYIDVNEESSLDSRLRVGEALLQVIQKAGQMFTGDLAHQVIDSLVLTAGRRGHRPKKESQQRKEALLSEKKALDASKRRDESPTESDSDPEDEILTQILQGWPSQRGTEDIRIRTSALSILGSAIESNITGLGSTKTSAAIDLSINILALEGSHSASILRRAAIRLFLSLLRALDEAEQHQTGRLGFGLVGKELDDVLALLGYVCETDRDGLVREYAAEVIEGLQSWRLRGLGWGREGAGGGNEGLGSLKGLSLGVPVEGNGVGVRPRIEEVE